MLSLTRNVLGVAVVRSLTALVCTATATFTGTLLAPFGGFVVKITGVTVAGAPLVMKWVVEIGTVLPARSFTPLTVSVITVLLGNTPCGMISTV